MKTPSHESNIVHIPVELLAEARRAADEEHRPADELVSDAVRRYLHERKHAEVSPTQAEAIARARELNPNTKKPLSELFAALRGSDIDLSRNPSTGRPVKL
jgi:hypothetical protein